MTKTYLGTRRVTVSSEEFPMQIGETLRVRDANPRFNPGFASYRIVSGDHKSGFIAQVTRHTPTTNKFQVGGPVIRG